MSRERQPRGEGESGVLTARRSRTRRPRRFKVLLHNDDFTTMEFVVEILRSVFGKSEPEAVHIMLTVHHRNVGVAGVYPREIAEAKMHRVHRLARRHQHPLRCSLEPETP